MYRTQAGRLSRGNFFCARVHILTGHPFTVLAISLNRNLTLLEEASTTDICVKLWFIIRFQNNKNIEARFNAVRYHYSFAKSVRNVYRKRSMLTYTQLKANLWCLQAQPVTSGLVIRIWVIKKHSVGSTRKISILWEQVFRNRTVGVDPWKCYCPCPGIGKPMINFSETSQFI